MGKIDPRVDAYIAKSADFAKPILERIRRLIHEACPEVEETIRWSFPSFTHKGILCHVSAFKHYCTFGFWHSGMRHVVKDRSKFDEAMGYFGKIISMADLPNDRLFRQYIKAAAKLNDSGVKPVRKPRPPKPLEIPADLEAALRSNKAAQATFMAFSPSHKREYADWISEAKRPETREKRLAITLEWLSEGKSRNWKYERK